MKKMKILTVMLMFIVLGVFPALADVSSDEGPTVIIVGSEQNKKEPPQDQNPENSDPYPIGENNGGETSPEDMGNEIEDPDQQYMEEDDQVTEEPEAFEEE
jgi:hypothetical protein